MSMEKEITNLTSPPIQCSTHKDELSSLATHSDRVVSIGPNKTCPVSKQPPKPIPYTVFTRNQKRRLRLLLGFATITSPLTATCYFPLLPLLRTHFETSAQAINLTLTIYIIFQALSPAVFGPFSDSIGRRLVLDYSSQKPQESWSVMVVLTQSDVGGRRAGFLY